MTQVDGRWGAKRVRVSPPNIEPDLISIRSLHLEFNSHSDSDSGELQSTLRTAWGVEYFFGNTQLSLELCTVIAGISGFDD
jgi:hypothetical protein